MIISPKRIISEWVISNVKNMEEQIQQNWIDLTLKSIEMLDTRYRNELTLKDRKHCKRDTIEFDIENWAMLQFWIYDIIFNEEVKISNWMCANIETRSTVNRWGNFITAWLYDAWYKGILWAILHVNVPIYLEEGVRLAQIVFSEAETWKIYNWVYNKKKVV